MWTFFSPKFPEFLGHIFLREIVMMMYLCPAMKTSSVERPAERAASKHLLICQYGHWACLLFVCVFIAIRVWDFAMYLLGDLDGCGHVSQPIWCGTNPKGARVARLKYYWKKKTISVDKCWILVDNILCLIQNIPHLYFPQKRHVRFSG